MKPIRRRLIKVSDGSNINFTPGYIMECPERENSSNDSSARDENNMGAYVDEPLANEEWLADAFDG